MRLFILGTLDLRGDRGGRIHAALAQPKRAALLAYLAAAGPGTTIRRDELYGVFWPELSQDHARHALSQALYGLRQALGADAVKSGTGGHLALAAGKLWCDAVAFRAALDAGCDAEALELYRGDLLPGFFVSGKTGFEAWLALERDRLRRRAAEAAWRLAGSAEREGRLEAAAAWARRGVDLSPDDEVALRHLIALLARLGDRAAAARAYETFANRLAVELELRPSLMTEQLIESIRNGAPVCGVTAKPDEPSRPVPPPYREAAHIRRRQVDPESAGTTSTVDALGLQRHGSGTSSRDARRPLPKRWSQSVIALLLCAAVLGTTITQLARRWHSQPPTVPSASARTSATPAMYRDLAAKDSATESNVMRARARLLSRVGRFFSAKRTPAGLATGIHYFELAVAADKVYAPAYSGLADAYVLLSWYDTVTPQAVGVRARDDALEAVVLDPSLPEAHASLGAVFAWIDGQGSLAEAEYKRSLALDPGYATAHDWYALQLASRGRTDSALTEATLAHDLDPTSLAIGADLGTILLWDGHQAAAIDQLRNTLALDSTFERARRQLWRAYAAAGRQEEAVKELERLMRFQGAPAQARVALRRAYAKRGWEGVLKWRLDALRASTYRAPARPVEAASLCALLGRRDQALVWLKKASDEHNEYLRFARLDPAFVNLRSDPRFLALIPE
jgi:DNA-binding transcriptional activator of the SARP family